MAFPKGTSMKQCTTTDQLDRERILTRLQELDRLYHADTFDLEAYEQTWQIVQQWVRQVFPCFTIAYAEIYTAGSEREPLGSMRHVLLPLPERNGQ